MWKLVSIFTFVDVGLMALSVELVSHLPESGLVVRDVQPCILGRYGTHRL